VVPVDRAVVLARRPPALLIDAVLVTPDLRPQPHHPLQLEAAHEVAPDRNRIDGVELCGDFWRSRYVHCGRIGMFEKPENRLLASLEPVDLSLTPHLRTGCFAKGVILQEQEALVAEVYFPLNGLVALVSVMDDGQIVVFGRGGHEFSKRKARGSSAPPQPFGRTNGAGARLRDRRR
jgi:hypothetical protein